MKNQLNMIVLVLFLALPAVAVSQYVDLEDLFGGGFGGMGDLFSSFFGGGELAPMCEKKAAIWA